MYLVISTQEQRVFIEGYARNPNPGLRGRGVRPVSRERVYGLKVGLKGVRLVGLMLPK